MSVFFGLLANPYDSCKDILRNGVRDTLSKNDTLDKKLSSHHQFCSIAKNHNLNENNFDTFAKDFAKSVHASSDSYGGGGGGGFGPFSFNANYQQNNAKNDLSEAEKIDLLKKNSREVIEHFKQNCGSSDYEESLKSEAALLSKVASPTVVNAWRDCMLGQVGFFADLIPSSQDLADDEIEYNAMVHWKSGENTEIASIVLTYREGKISTPYSVVQQNGGFAQTINICDFVGSTLKSDSNLPLTILHKDRKSGASFTIVAKNNTGLLKSHVLILPKLVLPTPLTLTSVASTAVPQASFVHDDNYMRSLMGNLNLQEDVTHSDDFMRNMMNSVF